MDEGGAKRRWRGGGSTGCEGRAFFGTGTSGVIGGRTFGGVIGGRAIGGVVMTRPGGSGCGSGGGRVGGK